MEHYKKINKELIMMNQELKIQLSYVQTELLQVRHQLLVEHSERVHNEKNMKTIMIKTFRRAFTALESDSSKWLRMLLDTDEDEIEDDETNAERTQSLQQHQQSNTQKILHTLRQSNSMSRRSSVVASPSRRFSERHSSGSILSVDDMSSSNRLNEILDPEMAPQQPSPPQTDVPQTEEQDEEEEEDDVNVNEQEELTYRIPSLIQEEDEDCDNGDELPDELPVTVAMRQTHNSQHERRRSLVRSPSPADTEYSDSECSNICDSTCYEDVAMTLTPSHDGGIMINSMRCRSPLHDISNQHRHVDAGVDKSPCANHSPHIELRRGKRLTLRKNIENARGAECTSMQLSMVEVATQPHAVARLSLSCGDIGATSIALSEMSITNFGQPLSSTTNESDMQKEEPTTMTAPSQQQGRLSRKCKPQNLTEPTLNVKMRNEESVSKHKSKHRSNKNIKK